MRSTRRERKNFSRRGASGPSGSRRSPWRTAAAASCAGGGIELARERPRGLLDPPKDVLFNAGCFGRGSTSERTLGSGSDWTGSSRASTRSPATMRPARVANLANLRRQGGVWTIGTPVQLAAARCAARTISTGALGTRGLTGPFGVGTAGSPESFTTAMVV